MTKTKTKLLCVQTYFEHWSKYSGYHQFLHHLGGEFEVEHFRIKRQRFPEKRKLYCRLVNKLLRKWFINAWTFENDLDAEFRLFNRVRNSLSKGSQVIVHFMDGEIGYNLFHFYRKVLPTNKNLKVVATYHQPPDILKDALNYKAKISSLDDVFIVGNSQRSFFSMCTQENVHFVPHGIDTDYFVPKNRDGKSEINYCVTVGEWLRDYNTLERIIRNAPGNFIFRIVSGRENTDRFADLSNVECYSGIDDHHLLELYQSSDIGLLPLSDSTANNSLLEMLACGLAVVTTDVGSVRDYINSEAGILISENDHEKYLHALYDIVQNPEKKKSLSQNARKRALELDLPQTAQKMRSYYFK